MPSLWTLLGSRIRVGELKIAERESKKVEGEVRQPEF